MTKKTATPRKRKATAGRRTTKFGAGDWRDDRYFPSENWTAGLIPTSAGIDVTVENARKFSAVFACIKIPSETLAATPIFQYRRLEDRSKEVVPTERVYKLLRLRPNRWQTPTMWKQQMFAHGLSWGNAYSRIVRDGGGQPAELQPIHPSMVTPKVAYDVAGVKDGTIYYEIRHRGKMEVILKRDMFHMVGITDDGVTGYSPIAAMREGIGLGIAAETFGSAFFGNGATPAAVIEYEGTIQDDAKDEFVKALRKKIGGPKKAGQVIVLDQKMKWKPIGIPVKDAQYIELRRFQIEEIARIYRVPLYKLQDHTHSTFSNVEHLAIEFVTDCLLPWAKRFEDAVLRDLLNAEAEIDDFSDELFVEFLFDGLLRGDIATRYAAYATGRQWGWLSINDIRRLENMNPIGEAGDVYLTPLNMIPAGEEDAQLKALLKPKEPDAKKAKGKSDEEDEPSKPAEDPEELSKRVREHFRGTFREAWARVTRKEIGSVTSAARKKAGVPLDWFEKFTTEQKDFARECLGQIYRTFAGVLGVGETAAKADLALALEEYAAEVAEAVGRFQGAPAEGYVRDEAEVSERWSERLLSAPTGRVMVAKEAA